MALLFMDGFDAGDYQVKWTTTLNAGGAFYSTATTRLGTGAALRVGNGAGQWAQKVIPASATTIVGCAFMNTVNGASNIFQTYGDGSVTNHINVTVNSLTGTFTVSRGGTVIATSAAGLLTTNQWGFVEAKIVISDTTGSVVVRLNGVTIITFSGDTKNNGTNNTIDMVRIQYDGSNGGQYYDDLYVLDGTGSAPTNDFLGDCRVAPLVPTGAGNTTGLTPSTGANWAAVDEFPYSATDYVQGSAAGVKDTYATADLPAGVVTVYGLQLNAVAKKTDAGARSLKTVVRRAGTDYADAGTPLLTNDSTIQRVVAADPSTSAAWAVAGVNAMEIGVEVL